MKAQGVAAALMVLAAALAGCAGDAPGATDEPLSTGGSTSPPQTTTGAPTPAVTPPRGTSQRWHFHDSWQGSPTITLLDANVTLNVSTGPDGLPRLSAIVELPLGTTVPAETGYLTFNATWEPETTGLLNLTYRPADSNTFHPAGDLALGQGIVLPTTESMCDVPHRQQSFWRFNVTAAPGGTPPQLPARTVHLTITATIGRPLFIDPPHLDWWRGGDVIPLVQGAKGEVATATTRAGNLTLPPLGASGAAAPPPPSAEPVRVGVDEGRIVPEGAKTVVLMLNWTSDVPNAKLTVDYREGNYPSSGPMQLSKDEPGARIFVLGVDQAQTDTTYSNRTTWEFLVRPDGTEGAFRGTFELHAWATRLSADAAIAILTASG